MFVRLEYCSLLTAKPDPARNDVAPALVMVENISGEAAKG